MRFTILVLILVTVANPTLSQIALDDIPSAIKMTRGTAIPVICRDSLWRQDSVQFGTGFLMGNGSKFVTITCEHVLAEKNPAGRTVRYLPLIFAHFNTVDSSAISIRMTLAYADEQNDFAILLPSSELANLARISRLFLSYVTRSQTLPADSLKEGEPVVYVGYPLFLGVGKRNYPLSRLGLIAQRVNGLPYFLIDGFAQHGHSGSPVFALRSKEDKFARILVGITRGFPKEFSEIVQETAFTTDSSRKAITNPGFTVVTPMDEILRVLRKGFDF
jgi:hypothetical protein